MVTPAHYLLVVEAARIGVRMRRERGTPPRDSADLAAWLHRQYRIHVGAFTRDLGPVAGAWKGLPGHGCLAGIIMVSPRLAHPRWTVAHEWGHYATGCRAGYSLAGDGNWHANLPEERAANAAAAAWLIPGDELVEMVADDWRRADIAAYYGIPESAVLLRRLLMPALGEVWPLLARAESELLTPDPWASA